MQTATALRVAMIVSIAFAATGADAGRVRVSQEIEGVEGVVVQGFVKTFDRSEMSAAAVYNYTDDDPTCRASYGGTTLQPAPDATVMALVDTSEGRTLFTVHNFPCLESNDSTVIGGTARMLFVLEYDDDDSMSCLVEDDPAEACEDATEISETPKIAIGHQWLETFTDGVVLGALDGRWQLDASFTRTPTGIGEVIVRSDGDGEIRGLSTDGTIRLDNVIEVGVDVQPGAEVGCLNIDGNGVIPVAILGAPDFDVDEVDISTLAFAGTQVRVRGNGQHQCAIEHVDTDGHADLVCQFFDDPDAWTPGNAMAAVSGELVDSTPIYGEDTICVRPLS